LWRDGGNQEKKKQEKETQEEENDISLMWGLYVKC
jgi:hypothetical protein